MIGMHAINERLSLIYKITKERDKYKRALEQIVKSTSETFRDIAREALNE